jgi:hypothetical protein
MSRYKVVSKKPGAVHMTDSTTRCSLGVIFVLEKG